MSGLRITARVVCAIVLVIAFFVIGPPSEHEVGPWMVASVAAILGIAGIGLGGAAVGILTIAFSFGLLRDHLELGIAIGTLLAFLGLAIEPFGVPASARRPRPATAAFVFALVSAPAVLMLFLLSSDNMRAANSPAVPVSLGLLAGAGGPLLHYILSGVRVLRTEQALGGRKRIATAGVVLSMLWLASLTNLATYALHRL